MTVRHLARAERADLLAFLRGLTPEQWEAPSLCAGWRVRDVVAHVVSYEGLGGRELARRLARGRLRLARTNAVGPRWSAPRRVSCSRSWNATSNRKGSPPGSGAASPCSMR